MTSAFHRHAVGLIREAGGTDIRFRPTRRHLIVEFVIDGRKERLTLHHGTTVPQFFGAKVRAQLRRKMENKGQ